MRLWALFALPIASLLFARDSRATFADEAYQTDYHLALLGAPQARATFFYRPSPASKASLLYTLSERFILGAINPKDGAIVWRQLLADQTSDKTSPGLLKAGEGSDSLVTSVDGVVSSWDATDGRLAWQWEGNEKIKSLDISQGERDVLIFGETQDHNAVVRKLSADTGTPLWEYRDPRYAVTRFRAVGRYVILTFYSGDVPYAILSCKDSIFLISLHPALLKGFKIKVSKLNAAAGVPIGQPTFLSSDEVFSVESILHIGTNSGIPYIIWTDKSFKSIRINLIGTKHVTHVNVPASDGIKVEDISVHAPASSAAKAHIVVCYQGAKSHWAEVYHIAPEKSSKAYDLPRLDGKGSFSANSQGSEVFFIRHTVLDNLLITSEDPAVLHRWKEAPESRGGLDDTQSITHVVSEVIPRGTSTFAVRSAMYLSSGNWKLIRNGETLWTRGEGLAGVIAATFAEIPTEKGLAKKLAAEGQSDPLTGYLHRVKRHFRDMQYLPGWVEALPDRFLGNLIGDKPRSWERNPHHDGFGFRKLIIVATDTGQLAALDTGNRGSMVWNIQAVNLKPNTKWKVIQIDVDEETALVHGLGGELLRIAIHTGAILQHQPGAISSSLKASVPVEDASGNKIHILVDSDGSLQDTARIELRKAITVVARDEANVIRGWALGRSAKPALLWRFTPAVGEFITNVSTRPSHDPVASIGKVLGDRNVLYKYLNPSILLITALAPDTSTASFYVLDAISGAIIYSISHPGVDLKRSVTSTLSENWFAYSLFSESTAVSQSTSSVGRENLKGYQLVISEFYESPYPNERSSLNPGANSSSIYPPNQKAEDGSAMPHVISQTYMIPGPVSSMSVTSTLQGITTRSLLFVLSDLHSVFTVSRAYVDPRRPVGRDPTPAEVEEGLFRYNPVLDFEPKWVLSHKRDLLTISNIVTSPSLLESTSLVFAFGEVDLFGTRTSPIGAFDILGNGFSKLQLALTVVALAVGTMLVAPFVSGRSVRV